MAALVGVIGVIALAAGAVAGLLVHRAEARAGADLAALAAAMAARVSVEGGFTPAPCAAARSVALANGVVLTACVAEWDGSVEVEVRSGTASARSRAGPAWTNENPTAARAEGTEPPPGA